MLRFTPRGAVREPLTVQIRVEPRFASRVPAGVPEPSRGMTETEVVAQIDWFARGRVGPRQPPVERVVFAGAGPDDPRFAAAHARCRALGLQLVAHASPRDVDAYPGDVRLAVPVHGAEDLRFERCAGVSVGISLTDGAMAGLRARWLEANRRFRRVVLSWPVPGGEPPASVESVRHALMDLPGAVVKGMTPCQLHGTPAVAETTGNRWYVDADHMLQQALLFFPALVPRAKPDSCRWCAAARTCDGLPVPWLDQGRAGPLEPLAH